MSNNCKDDVGATPVVALETLDGVMIGEPETTANQRVVECIANIIAAYENALESVQDFVLAASGCESVN